VASHVPDRILSGIISRGDSSPYSLVHNDLEKRLIIVKDMEILMSKTRPGDVRRACLAGVLSLVVGAQLMSVNLLAQTKSQITSRLVDLAYTRAKNIKVNFTYGPTSPKAGQTIQFVDTSTGDPLSWSWDFGDGSTSIEQNPTHKYSTAGFRRVTLLATSRTDSRKSAKTIAIMSDMGAAFSFSPMIPGPGETVQFTDTSSGSPTSWQWDFGDGATSSLRNPSHVYQRAASYTVTLISGNGSGSMQASRTLAVASMSVLSSSFNYAPVLPSIGEAVQFTDMSAGAPTSWLWDFGDGTTSIVRNPCHAFAVGGFYPVTLTVSNGNESTSSNRTISVAPALLLEASFSYGPASPTAGQPVLFTDTSSGNPTSWIWDFGDGTTSNVQNPSHSFATAGPFSISLTVTSSTGSKTYGRVVTIVPASGLNADFSFSPDSPVLGQTVKFTDMSTGNPASWLWDFGDSVTSSLQNPDHAYAAAGSYSVSLTIGSASNSHLTTKTILVGYADAITAASPSYADVSAAIAKAKEGDTVIIPAGVATWSRQLVITKYITLVGPGKDSLTIHWGGGLVSNQYDSANFMIKWILDNPDLDLPWGISGMTWDFHSKCPGLYLAHTSITPTTKLRIHDNALKNPIAHDGGGRAMLIWGNIYGVIDSNEIDGGIVPYGLNEKSWAYLTFSYGSADQLYIEDNVIYCWGSAVGGGVGGRYCARYNKIHCVDPNVYYQPFEYHGNADNAGGMGMEIIGNTIYNDTGGSPGMELVQQRGGMSIVYDNVIAASFGGGSIVLREEYLDSVTPPAFSPDGESQHICRSYYWNNTKDGAVLNLRVGQTVNYGGTIGAVPQEDREFWQQKPSFNGTTGMGVGPLADRPLKGILGVGYWATDVNRLFRWTANNVWEEYYTPYAFPHPLRNNS
jgi:PKD repeat protein